MNAAARSRFTMLGAPDALACEGDTCLLPGGELPDEAPDDRLSGSSASRSTTGARTPRGTDDELDQVSDGPAPD